jgi:hypothetical protein
MKALEVLHAEDLPCGTAESDAKNAYCSIHRSAIQRGLARLAPKMLPIFDFHYGPDAHARAFFFAGGERQPKGSCALPSGVHQGDVFGPFFFSVAFDELMMAVRARLADLPVDSSMAGKALDLLGDGVRTPPHRPVRA